MLLMILLGITQSSLMYNIPKKYMFDYVMITILMILFTEKMIIIMSLTKGGRKNNGPAFSAGQWPSLACKAEKKWTALLSAAVAFSFVISSPSSTFTGGIVCLKFFSLRNYNHFDK